MTIDQLRISSSNNITGSLLRLATKQSFPTEAVVNSANIIRGLIEEYDEKQEEQHIFPRIQKLSQLTDLVQVLLQHQAGRKVTDEIIALTSSPTRTESEAKRLMDLPRMLNTTYNTHEPRKDTELLPAHRKIKCRKMNTIHWMNNSKKKNKINLVKMALHQSLTK